MKHHWRLVWGYRGHNSGLYERGRNWWQITFPWSRRLPRVALIVTQIEEQSQ